MEPWADVGGACLGEDSAAAAGWPRLVEIDIARMTRPDKAMSEDFVNALCDSIQPNPSQRRAVRRSLAGTLSVRLVITISKRALTVTVSGGSFRQVNLQPRGGIRAPFEVRRHPPPNAMQPALGSDCGGKHRQTVDGAEASPESMPLLRNRHIAPGLRRLALPCCPVGSIVAPAQQPMREIEMKTVLSFENQLHLQQDRTVHVSSRFPEGPAPRTP